LWGSGEIWHWRREQSPAVEVRGSGTVIVIANASAATMAMAERGLDAMWEGVEVRSILSAGGKRCTGLRV